MARFWLGPWHWNSDPESPGWWSAPVGSLGALDLRSLPQCGTPSTPLGFGLFVTADATALGRDYVNLGTDPTRTLTENQKRQWESALGLPATLVTNRIMAIVYETLTLQADPTGDTRCLPLMPTMRRRFEVWLAGQKVSDREWSFTAPEFDVSRDTLKRVYRQLREGSLEGKLPPELYRKWLGFQVRKYLLSGNQYRALQPADLPDETPLEPATTIIDDFTRADGTTIGNQLSWTEIGGDWQTVTNQAAPPANNANVYARAESALSSDDHYSQVVATAFIAGTDAAPLAIGGAARFDPAATTMYRFILSDRTGDQTRLQKIVAGVVTQLGDNVATIALPQTVKVQADGSTITGHLAGVQVRQVTDTGITGHVRTGISGFNFKSLGDALGDDFEAADLAAVEDLPPGSIVLSSARGGRFARRNRAAYWLAPSRAVDEAVADVVEPAERFVLVGADAGRYGLVGTDGARLALAGSSAERYVL